MTVTPTLMSPPADLLARYRRRIVRTVAADLTSLADLRDITYVVDSSVQAFIASAARVDDAVAEVGSVLEMAGERLARAGGQRAHLEVAFRSAARAAQKDLALLIGGQMNRDLTIRLREEVMAYLVRLHRCALTGFDRSLQLLAMSDEKLQARLSAVTFGPGDVPPRDLARMASHAGIGPHARLVVIVSVDTDLPEEMRSKAHVLSQRSSLEILVPERLGRAERLAEVLRGQVVVSPPIQFAEAPHAVLLARRAADLLRKGRILDDRPIVPYVDLLGELIVSDNEMLNDLLIQKHLAKLDAASPSRRVTLALVLVRSLESGLPTNALARELGIPAQTAHSRMNVLRSMIGDAIDDGGQRLELIVALRAALPRWIEES